jgi:hypothetical protein
MPTVLQASFTCVCLLEVRAATNGELGGQLGEQLMAGVRAHRRRPAVLVEVAPFVQYVHNFIKAYALGQYHVRYERHDRTEIVPVFVVVTAAKRHCRRIWFIILVQHA